MARLHLISLKMLPWILGIYSIATLTSMAGMRVFGFLTAVLSLAVLVSGDASKLIRQITASKIDKAILLLFGAILISALVNELSIADRLRVLSSSHFILLYFSLRVALETVNLERVSKFIPVLVAIIGLVGVYAIFESLTGIDLVRGPNHPMDPFPGGTTFRARGFYHHPVSFGHAFSIALCLPIAGLLLQSSIKTRQWLFLAVVTVVGILGALLSYTRGAWVALFAAIAVMSLFRLKKAAPIGVFLILIVIAAYFVDPSGLTDRAKSAISTSYESNSIRLDVWKANFAMFKDHPVFGIGYHLNEARLGSYFDKLGIHQEFRGHAHNIYLQMAAGIGIVGFTIFLLFIVITFTKSVAGYREISKLEKSDFWLRTVLLACIGSQVELWVGGMTDVPMIDFAPNRIFFLLLALAVSWMRVSSTPYEEKL